MKYKRLCDIQISPEEDKPLGGLNPYNKYYHLIGQEFFNIFLKHGIVPTTNILDIGCGTGRIAKALINFLTGRYIGCDVNKQFITWCQNNFRANNFTFECFDIRHDEYNPDGQLDASNFRFPYADASFDCICAIALFNHLYSIDVANYIMEIGRMLRDNGIAIFTCMLLNEYSITSLDTVVAHPFLFEVRSDEVWYEYVDRKLLNVAIQEYVFRRYCLAAKLTIKEPIQIGQWCGLGSGSHGHDIVVCRKHL